MVQIGAPQLNGGTELGSGYRVTDAYVLTATHVIGSARTETIAVQSHAGRWTSGVAAHLDLGDDLSLLQLRQPVAAETSQRITPPPYGRLDESPGLMAAVAVGYPRRARKNTAADLTLTTQPYWDLGQADGRIAALNNLLQGTFQFDIDPAAANVVATAGGPQQRWVGGPAAPDSSPWRGMSGAALWVNHLLVGVVTADDTPTGVPRLIATRLDHVLARLDRDDPAAAARARSALGLAPGQRLADAAFNPGFLLDAHEAKALQKILLADSAGAPLRAMYRQATENLLDLPDNPDDLDAYIGVLRRRVDPNPLFRFLVRFAAAADPDTTRRLEGWIDRTAARYGVDLNEVRLLREELKSTVLLLQLEPDMLGSGWQVTAWRFVGPSPCKAAAPDESWTREELGHWLSTELSKLVDDFDEEDGTTQVTVEFQVSDDALDDDLEWLPVMIAGNHRPIGATCPVVKRSSGRLSQPTWAGNWETKWRRLKECGDSYKADIIHWIQQPGPFQWEGTHVAAALAYAWERSDWPQILQALLEAGTPVAVWQRKPTNAWGRRAALEAVLINAGLYRVPERVLAQRIKAARQSDDDHIGRNLVLLWDDPEHVPNQHQLQAPQYEGVGA